MSPSDSGRSTPRPPGGGGRFARFTQRGPWMRVLYVAAIAAVWVAIALVATVLVFSQGLPDISKLYTIQRQP